MPIDFDRLVLGTAMSTFGQPIIVRPIASKPGQATAGNPGLADYLAVGVFSQRPVDVALDDAGVHSTNQTTLGIRLSTFATAPVQDDFVCIQGTWYVIFDSNSDGQGGAVLDLRQADPP